MSKRRSSQPETSLLMKNPTKVIAIDSKNKPLLQTIRTDVALQQQQ